MKKLRTTLIIVLFSVFIISCKSDREREIESINMESIKIIKSLDPDMMYKANMTAEGSIEMFKKISADSAELGLKYANGLKFITDSIRLVVDSLDKVAQLEVEKAQEIINKRWEKSKAGKIQKKHPYWTKEECENVSKNLIWIGMSLEMLKYERGLPSRINTSDYGNGIEYQWCWDGYNANCFYGKEDCIITSYN